MAGTTTPKTPGWARLWPVASVFAKPMPRAGARYPIVAEAGDSRLVLEVLGRRVAVHRRFLEVRDERPGRFTVVSRSREQSNPASGTSADLGHTYAVCPACGARASLWGQPAILTCAECRHRGEVAWWETG